MRIDSLELINFRNYEKAGITFDPSCNVIYGDNAQGKTNLLEAIVYVTSLHSPRTRQDKELIRFGENRAEILGNVYSQERERCIKTVLQEGQRKKVWLNDIPIKKSADLLGICNTVFFCPEDLNLIRNSAAERRKFLDTSISQLKPKYEDAVSAYNKIYTDKTRILRDWEEKPDLLKVLPDFNEQLTYYGAVVIHYRAHYVKKLQEFAGDIHKECSGEAEELSIRYETVSTIENPFAPIAEIQAELRKRQEQLYEAELSSRLCLCGPHKDDLSIAINGNAAKSFGSQGQIRTAALSMKMADREIHRETIGEYPVLLLDDVLSELDKKRQDYVLNRIQGGQVFITCCEDDRLATMMGGKVFSVQQGSVQ